MAEYGIPASARAFSPATQGRAVNACCSVSGPPQVKWPLAKTSTCFLRHVRVIVVVSGSGLVELQEATETGRLYSETVAFGFTPPHSYTVASGCIRDEFVMVTMCQDVPLFRPGSVLSSLESLTWTLGFGRFRNLMRFNTDYSSAGPELWTSKST